LRINQLEQVLDGGGITRSPITEKYRDFTRIRQRNSASTAV